MEKQLIILTFIGFCSGAQSLCLARLCIASPQWGNICSLLHVDVERKIVYLTLRLSDLGIWPTSRQRPTIWVVLIGMRPCLESGGIPLLQTLRGHRTSANIGWENWRAFVRATSAHHDCQSALNDGIPVVAQHRKFVQNFDFNNSDYDVQKPKHDPTSKYIHLYVKDLTSLLVILLGHQSWGGTWLKNVLCL